MASLKVICSEIETLDQLRTYEPIWRELFAHSAQPSAFASWDWFINYWKHIGPGPPNENNPGAENSNSPLFLIEIYNAANEVVALVPLYWAFQSAGALRIRVIRIVGDLNRADDNPNEEPIVLLKSGYENDAIAALRRYLRFRPSEFDWTYASIVLPLAGVTDDRATTLGQVKSRWRDRLYRRYIHTAEFVSLPADWGIFTRSLTKSMRDNLKYYPRLIERHGHKFAIRVARTVQEMPDASGVLVHLHCLRSTASQGVQHINHLPTEAHYHFVRESHTALAAKGLASIYILSVDGLDVAAQSVLESPEGFSFYYSGFDPASHMYSPLTILAGEILKEAVERQVTTANLLHFPILWKSRWGARSVDRSDRVTCLRLHIPSLVKFGLYQGVVRGSHRLSASLGGEKSNAAGAVSLSESKK